MQVKQCACGQSFTIEQWRRLKRLGELDDGVDLLELRDCPCGSTLAIVIGKSRN